MMKYEIFSQKIIYTKPTFLSNFQLLQLFIFYNDCTKSVEVELWSSH